MTQEKPKPTRRRKRRRPVRNEDGELVTPVSGLPAAHINWAPPCPACKTRTCQDCGHEQRHAFAKCRECDSDKLSAPHLGEDTFVASTQKVVAFGSIQNVKCRTCGHSWQATIRKKSEDEKS